MFIRFQMQSNTTMLAVILVTNCSSLLFGASDLYQSQEAQDQAIDYLNKVFTHEEALLKIASIRKTYQMRIDETKKKLDVLEDMVSEYRVDVDALLTNDHGRLLAQEPNLPSFATFIRLYEEPAVTLSDIKIKQAQASFLDQSVSVGVDDRKVGYLLDIETQDEINRLRDWVNQKQTEFNGQLASLKLLTDPKLLYGRNLSQAKTLSEAVSDYQGRWEKFKSIAQQLARTQMSPEVQKVLVEVYKFVELENGKLQADIIKTQKDLRLARTRQENEIEMRNQEFQRLRVRRLADEDHLRREGDLDNQIREQRALRELANLLKQQVINKIEVDVERQRLIAEATSHDVQTLLAPFIRKSYWQPNNRMKQGYERSGMSYSGIKGARALNPTPQGLQNLLTLGTNPKNKDRGPWPWPRRIGFLRSEEQREDLRQAQDYLIRLGPTLVELGHLAK